jgi:hypothetical protein|tara:strand:- start:247 stop:441 length:195 start_codon:yes stop_codon:yes gene_type:complete
MKLHGSTINEIVRIMETHGGYAGETRLKKALSELDISVYSQSSTGKDVLVPTKTLLKETTPAFQ